MKNVPPKPGGQRQLKLYAEHDMKAYYANTAVVSMSPYELFLDFVQMLPTDQRARVVSRVVMSPVHAKHFARLLNENLARYEEQHGEIKLGPKQPSLAEQLFGSIQRDGDGEPETQPETEDTGDIDSDDE